MGDLKAIMLTFGSPSFFYPIATFITHLYGPQKDEHSKH